MSRAPPRDRNGREVVVGMRVRVVCLSRSFLDSLPDDEVEDVASMVGEVFEVHEIDEYGAPWVGKEWMSEDGEHCLIHNIALDAEEMEIVDR